MTGIKIKALVVLSGGQDSVTCLAWALHHYDEVEAITFFYGQRHQVELQCARAVCREMGVPQKVVDMSFLGDISTSALTGEGDVKQPHALNSALPASFVPNRNTLFLTAAHAWAQTIGANVVVAGMCETDYSGYPDCRDKFIKELNHVLDTGSEARVEFRTPLMYLSKAATFALAEHVGALDIVLEISHTCYEGDRSVRHAWGYGCGECPSCVLRRKGWEDYNANKAITDV